VYLECVEGLLPFRPDLGLLTQEDIHDNSEYETNNEEMTGEKISQLFMKHDRKFHDSMRGNIEKNNFLFTKS
jgi:hypothetical protein